MTPAPARAQNRLKEIFCRTEPASMPAALASACRIKRKRHRWRRIVSGRRDYNYFRDYEPGTGRYVESDPLGLMASPSTYGYVDGNPSLFVDPTGLVGWHGTEITYSVTSVIGAVFKYYSLTSDCVDHKRATASIGMIGLAIAPVSATTHSGTATQVDIEDYSRVVDPNNLVGWAGDISAVAAATDGYSFGLTILGIMGDNQCFGCGGESIGPSRTYGWAIGFGVSVGKSKLLAPAKWETCDECEQ